MIIQLMMPVLTGKGPDFSKLTEKEGFIGDYRLGYKLPGNTLDIGRPKKSRPTLVDLQESLFETYEPEKLYKTLAQARRLLTVLKEPHQQYPEQSKIDL